MEKMAHNHRTPWTLHEMRIVERDYGKVPTREIARKLGRSVTAVRSQASALGCSKALSELWRDEEIEVLRTHYARGDGIALVMTLLPGRTRKTIFQKAINLGITSARSWSEEECRILAEHYPAMGVKVAALLGRTEEGVKIKASYMKIRFAGDASSSSRPWTGEEKKCLLENMALPLGELCKLFPERSYKAVQKARNRYKKQAQHAV